MWMVVAAVAVSGIIGIFTDWLFMGVLFHGAYNAHPEIWRPQAERKSTIIWASVLGFVMSAGVVALCALADVGGVFEGLLVGFVAWAAGPFVILVINGMFVKIDRKITFAHCLGYLARMLIAGVAAGIALPLP